MNVKNDFPFLVKNHSLVYFDSACTSLKPQSVIDAEIDYYQNYAACGSRSGHKFGRLTSEKIQQSREKIAKFVNAHADEVIFTRNTTESLNLVINSFDFSKRRKVVTTIMEHHSVLLPLFRKRDEGAIQLEVLPAKNGIVSLEQWKNAIDKNTALVVTNNASNTTGYQQNTREIAKICQDNGALICVDGAQGVPHFTTDFSHDAIDFLCFSGHKMLGPTGIGCLVANRSAQEKLKPFLLGGGTVKTVSLDNVVPLANYERFEAGIQHYAGIFGLATACEYLKKIGMKNVEEHQNKFGSELRKAVENSEAHIYGANGGIISFNFKNAAPHEVALMLDKQNIAVRSGFFCAQPAMENLGATQGAVRASCYVYNSLEEVKKFSEALQKLSALYA